MKRTTDMNDMYLVSFPDILMEYMEYRDRKRYGSVKASTNTSLVMKINPRTYRDRYDVT
jgi:hypothetical protein